LKCLAFDTSTEWCTVALWLDGELSHREVLAGQTHSRILLPMVNELLAESGLVIGQLDGIAYGMGPGSFTGLRIACGVVQGLGLGTGLPVLGVSGLEAMAQESAFDRVVTALDARMGEIYAALWQRESGQWRASSGPAVYRPEAAPLPDTPGWLGCGSAFAAYAEPLGSRYGALLAEVKPGIVPHARSIAELAVARFARGEGYPADQAEPYYVRNKVALKTSER
jgi:tRNA threonylcarbamoyladenosine biosynthesis protein TsaB